jgi:hypothetical protein
MTSTKEAMKKVIEEKRLMTKNQGKKKRPETSIGEARKRRYNKKPGGLFDK